MKFVRDIWSDLVDKRLWPVAAVLLAAAIAVPVLLGKSASSPTSVAAAGAPAVATPAGEQLPVVNVSDGSPPHTVIGRSRDPFTPAPGTTTGPTGATGPVGPTKSTTTQTTSSTSSSAATGSSTTGGATAPTTTSTPAPAPKPAPSGLTATQAYQVSLGVTNGSGGVYTIGSLERLSPVPSRTQPLLVYLGVLNGGRKALFLVQPGTVVGVPASECTPGPADCEVIAVTPDQLVSLSVMNGKTTVPVATMAVTSIGATDYPSAAAAGRTRRAESATGVRLLRTSTLSALSLFQYRSSLGAVVDLSNLSVSGG
jgi:hypothetical protein